MGELDRILRDRQRVILRELPPTSLGGPQVFDGSEQFELCDEAGEQIGFTSEESHFTMSVGPLEFGTGPYSKTKHLLDAEGRTVATAKHPYRWWAKRADVYEGKRRLGSVARRWSWGSRKLVIENSKGVEAMDLVGPLLLGRTPTFRLRFQGQVVGRVSREPRGLLERALTLHDTVSLSLEFEPHVPVELRTVLLFAALLIDELYLKEGWGFGED